MNQKLVDNEVSLNAYRTLYKRFADSIPEDWLYTIISGDSEL